MITLEGTTGRILPEEITLGNPQDSEEKESQGVGSVGRHVWE